MAVALPNPSRPPTYFDITIGGAPTVRVVSALNAGLVPRIAENLLVIPNRSHVYHMCAKSKMPSTDQNNRIWSSTVISSSIRCETYAYL
jgi:hypothetical protein